MSANKTVIFYYKMLPQAVITLITLWHRYVNAAASNYGICLHIPNLISAAILQEIKRPDVPVYNIHVYLARTSGIMCLCVCTAELSAAAMYPIKSFARLIFDYLQQNSPMNTWGKVAGVVYLQRFIWNAGFIQIVKISWPNVVDLEKYYCVTYVIPFSRIIITR